MGMNFRISCSSRFSSRLRVTSSSVEEEYQPAGPASDNIYVSSGETRSARGEGRSGTMPLMSPKAFASLTIPVPSGETRSA